MKNHGVHDPDPDLKNLISRDSDPVANPTVSRQVDRQQAGRQAGIRFGSKSNREQADSSWRLDGGP
eukprot:SAG25_NODE_530_length_7159_cov_113.818697_1_plen_65_part_10